MQMQQSNGNGCLDRGRIGALLKSSAFSVRSSVDDYSARRNRAASNGMNHGPRHDGGPADDGGPAGAHAARANHAASADHGACFHGAQGDEASCQQYRDNQISHDCSPSVASGWSVDRFRIVRGPGVCAA
jgi:hypothetical protein